MLAVLNGFAIALTVLAALGGVHLYSAANGPLFEPIAATRSVTPPRAAVILSGDSGFSAGLSRQVGKRLAANGIGVIGINAHRFFVTRRTPAETAALLGDAMARARALTGATKVLLIGQSYGADMLQAALAEFTPAQRAEVSGVVLVVPGQTLFFQISWSERYDLTAPDAPALPTAKQLDWLPVMCVRGADESGSLCPDLTQPNLTQAVLPGGHYLHHSPGPLTRRIAAFITGLPQ